LKDAVILPSFAKINWALRVLGRRTDGYHEIETVLQTINLHDLLRFDPREDSKVEINSDSATLPIGEKNIIHRAASLLQRKTGTREGVTVTLTKRIPAGGGLGGGSSNAAITLLALSYLWNLEISREDLIRLGVALGADVPFFFYGGTAHGRGTGTNLESLEDIEANYLLVASPGVEVSTAEAYRALNSPALTNPVSPIKLMVSRGGAEFSDILDNLMHNDFEDVIFQRHPEIARLRDLMAVSEARKVLLSGSGSSLFAVFESPDAQLKAKRLLEESNVRVFACSTLSRRDYLENYSICSAWL
jgi:4-diphosphocytidyl-2-C-methyl-D-erythritol kinase